MCESTLVFSFSTHWLLHHWLRRMRESSLNRLYLFLFLLHYSTGSIHGIPLNTEPQVCLWCDYESLSVVVGSSGIVYYFAVQHSYARSQTSFFMWFVQAVWQVALLRTYARLHNVLFGLRGGMVWGRKPLSVTKKCSLALSPTHIHTFSLFLSAWMGSVLAASANPAGMLEECERWVRDWEREIEKEGLCG